jgi:hypothetical protein
LLRQILISQAQTIINVVQNQFFLHFSRKKFGQFKKKQ